MRSDASLSATVVGVTPMAGWTTSATGGQWRASFKGFSQHEVSHWRNGAREVQVDRFGYGAQQQGAEMVSYGNRLAPDSMRRGEQVIGPLDQQLRTVRETVVQVDRSFRLAWWWYRVGGVSTPVGTKAQFLELYSALTGAPASEIVVVSAPCPANDCGPAREALHEVVTGRPLPPASQK
jgi:EpsI family protein